MLQLDESLFNSKKLLHEAFSASMPSWLKRALNQEINNPSFRAADLGLDAKPRNKNARQKFDDSTSKGGVVNSTQFGYSTKGRSTKDTLFGGFQRAGIDISKAKFIDDGDIPAHPKSDPRLKAPNIPIFLLKWEWENWGNKYESTQVYAKGINDYQVSMFTDSRGNNPLLKQLPDKVLIEHCIGFCYLDGSDQENLIGTRKEDRATMKNELSKIPDYYRNVDAKSFYQRNPSGKMSANRWDKSGAYYDKSGYLVNPKKYEDELKKSGKVNYASKLDKIYRRLVDAQQDLSRFISNMDPSIRSEQTPSYDLYRTNALSKLNDCYSYYKNLLAAIDNYTNAISAGSDSNVLQDCASTVEYYLERTGRYIDAFEDSLDSVGALTSVVDW